MTVALINLLLAGAPPFLIWNLAEVAPAPTVQAESRVVVRTNDPAVEEDMELIVLPDGANAGDMVFVTADGDCQGAAAGAVPFTVRVSGAEGEPVEGAHAIFLQSADGQTVAEGDAPKMVFVRAPGDGQSGGHPRTALVKVAPRTPAPSETDAAERGWLGVSVGDVSDAMAEQLNLNGNGVLIMNVVSDSPADKAGIQAHDIIMAVNGETVEGEVGRTVDLIKARKPGETVAMSVLRDGQPQTIRVTLGSRAEMPTQAFAWKFETAPEGQVEESVKTRGKFIAKGADGQWIVRDLGDLNNAGELPGNVRMFLPRSGERTTSVNVEGGKSVVRVNVSQDGSSVSIQREGDGPITVERTDANGNKTEADYDTEEALETADAEAYKMFKQGGNTAVFHVNGGHWVDGNFDFNFDFDSEQFHDAMEAWKVDLSELQGEAREAYEKAMEELHSALEKAKGEGLDGKLGDLKGLMKLRQLEPGHVGVMHMGKARQSFEVRPDGTIESRVRKGDSELVELYKNEADMMKRNPDLYEKYQDLKSSDE